MTGRKIISAMKMDLNVRRLCVSFLYVTLVAVLLIPALAPPASARQGYLTVRVRDAETGHWVSGALVQVYRLVDECWIDGCTQNGDFYWVPVARGSTEGGGRIIIDLQGDIQANAQYGALYAIQASVNGRTATDYPPGMAIGPDGTFTEIISV